MSAKKNLPQALPQQFPKLQNVNVQVQDALRVPLFNTSQLAKYQPSNKNKRFVAFVIDSSFSSGVGKLLNILVIKGFHIKSSMLVSTVDFLMVAVIYWVLLTLVMGATPGKKIMGLRIVTKDQSLDVGFGQLLLRETIGRVLSALPFLLGYAWVSWDKERRTFHDMISKTRVVDFR